MVDILGLSGMVRVFTVYADTQTQGVDHGGHPRIVPSNSDTGAGLVMVDILGLSGMVRVSPSNVDTQTQGVGHGRHP